MKICEQHGEAERQEYLDLAGTVVSGFLNKENLR
jgi:hypothetical protein